jgi:hypothetical protein
MTVSVNSPEDVINLSLARIGYKKRIGSIWEGSAAARKALDIYGQTRDEMLRAGDWEFCEVTGAPLTVLKAAPSQGYTPANPWNPTTFPPPGWAYSYAYPSDCLDLRAVKPVSSFAPNFAPVPHRFGIDVDNTLSPAAKVILADFFPAVAVYCSRVTNPQIWDADFIEAFAAELGRRLAPVLTDPRMAQVEAADAAQATMVANDRRLG